MKDEIKTLKEWAGEPSQIVYVTSEAEGALPNGSMVEKMNSEPSDAHQDGALGRVRGSKGPFQVGTVTMLYVYWVEWADFPGVPVAILSHRIKPYNQKGGHK